jgi:hypothetical protein
MGSAHSPLGLNYLRWTAAPARAPCPVAHPTNPASPSRSPKTSATSSTSNGILHARLSLGGEIRLLSRNRNFPNNSEEQHESLSRVFRHRRQKANRISSIGNVPLTALVLVLGSVAKFGAVHEADEGAIAHLWLLLMPGQLPLLAFFAIKWLPRAPSKRSYSERSAFIGSTCVARRAGIQTARKATALSNSGVTMKVAGSQAFTPNRKAARK